MGAPFPTPSGDDNIRFALLRDAAITPIFANFAIARTEKSEVCADLCQQYDTPGSPTDVQLQRPPVRKHMGATQVADERGKILRFAVAPSREDRVYTGAVDARSAQALFAARGDAPGWMEADIMRLQREEGDRQMRHLRSAMACVRAAKLEWPEFPTALHDEVNEPNQ